MGPLETIEGESLLFVSVFAAAAFMGKVERRSFADYALPLRGAFGRRFWEGVVWGLAALSALVLVMWLGHGFGVNRIMLGGREIFSYGGLWALAFLAVAFFEEFLMRGYALFTLTTGIGFWPSAVALSLLFGAVHLGNSGETWVGALSAGLVGLFFCLKHEIPATLQDLVMARLDRMASNRDVAQLAATLGREFSYELLAAVAPLDEATLQAELAKLVQAELLTLSKLNAFWTDRSGWDRTAAVVQAQPQRVRLKQGQPSLFQRALSLRSRCGWACATAAVRFQQ